MSSFSTGEHTTGAPDPVDVVELTRALVRAPSPNPPGDERAVAQVVGDVLGPLGLPRARTIACHAHRPNLLVELAFGPGGRHLVLSGHLDTKPVGDAVWSHDPLAADVEGGRLYGLGATDMKGAVAAMLVAAGRLAVAPPARGRLTLLFTADEEDGAAYGARHVAATVPLHADAVVIGEPGGIETDFDRLHVVSRGIARLRLSATARQGHSSLSAVLGARNAGVDLARLVAAVADGLSLALPDDPYGLQGWDATVNPAMTYTGGVGYGVLPDRITAATEVRLLPGMRRDDLMAAFQRVVADTARRSGGDLACEFDTPSDWLPATMVDPDHPLVAAARRACAALAHEPPLSVFPGTTDATWFSELQGLPTLPALGPGLLRRAHGADEWVDIDAVRRSVDLYAALATAFCAGADA